MSEEDDLSLNEALLIYAEIKVEMAKKFREGISYEDFYNFEKKLDIIDGILKKEAVRISEELEEERR